MMRSLRFKLLFFLIFLAIVLVSVVSYVNRQFLIQDTQALEVESRKLIENHILTDMHTIDKVYYHYFDRRVADDMEYWLRKMIEKYKVNPDVRQWNLEEMKKEHGMDIYIIDQAETIIYTTFAADQDFNFHGYSEPFARLLEERRQTGKFYSDNIDISINTGVTKKYSYLATPDKKYLFELGQDFKDEPVFRDFNFYKTSQNLMKKYKNLLDVKIINANGTFIDQNPDAKNVKELSKQFRNAYRTAQDSMKPVEYTVNGKNGVKETYRFIPYESSHMRGTTTKRVVFVKYGNSMELERLEKNTKQFWILLFVGLIISFIMLSIIIRILTKTIRLATYDALTGVYNRATYITKMSELLKRKNSKLGLLLVDLDNFKLVNDQLGHAVGDMVLKDTAKMLQNSIKEGGFVSRFGGDEFAIVVYDVLHTPLQDIAENIVHQVRHYRDTHVNKEAWHCLSVSAGGAIVKSSNDAEVNLFERADKALYKAKNNGKDQFSLYVSSNGN